MSRTVARISPIVPYGLDLPFTAFNAGVHANYKFSYLSDRAGVAMKFFEMPIYTHTHAIVRIPKDQYGKISFSVNPDEAAFIRTVEKDVMDSLDRIVGMAEPSLNVSLLPTKSVTYENLMKLRLNKTIGQDLEGKLIPVDRHEDLLTRGVKVLMTVEVYGLYHSTTAKGVLARVHCYRMVESF